MTSVVSVAKLKIHVIDIADSLMICASAKVHISINEGISRIRTGMIKLGIKNIQISMEYQYRNAYLYQSI